SRTPCRCDNWSISSPRVSPAGTTSSATPAAARAPAKYRTVTPSLALIRSATNRGHRAGRLEEAGFVDAVAGLLDPHRGTPPLRTAGAVGAGAKRGAQLGLLAGEQAVAHLPVGGQPGAVALTTERPGDTGDHTHLRRAAGRVEVPVHQPRLRRRPATVGRIG